MGFDSELSLHGLTAVCLVVIKYHGDTDTGTKVPLTLVTKMKTPEITCRPVGRCFASFTLAKLPLPMVLISRYFPICGSSVLRPAGDPIRALSSDIYSRTTYTRLCT